MTKTQLTAGGELPFELTVNGTMIRLRQDETKLILSTENDQYAANLAFDIYYPNGTPDEMADREHALREEIKGLKKMFQPSAVSLGESVAAEAPQPSPTSAARDKELEDALAARDLYKSQLESLNAKYEALVHRNGSFLLATAKLRSLIHQTGPQVRQMLDFLRTLEDTVSASEKNS
jgi:hypothetical protein